tara:strand:- start:2625 stop:2759 length:135 start_codon:yes stop_codon:yes gene_type:complete
MAKAKKTSKKPAEKKQHLHQSLEKFGPVRDMNKLKLNNLYYAYS